MTGMPALAGQPAEEPGPRLAAGPSNQAADQSLAERRIRAIVVDDNTTIRQAVRDALQESGVVVIAQASDGREGVELAWHYKPDVVVLDVFMPGLDGISAMQRIHERLPDACCIMLSVSADRELGIMALRAGAAGFLTKGAISPTRLADIIRGAGGARGPPRPPPPRDWWPTSWPSSGECLRGALGCAPFAASSPLGSGRCST
jgi:CheY-like chemotaxis protein